MDTFSKVVGKSASFIQVSSEQYLASLPPVVAKEFLENHLFIEEPGYYLGEPLEPTLELVDSEPSSWEEFVEKHVSTWN